MATTLVLALAVAFGLLTFGLVAHRRRSAAFKLGFVFAFERDEKFVKQSAVRLYKFAAFASDMVESCGGLPVLYHARLTDFGLDPKVMQGKNPHEIADICQRICTVLKC